MLLNHIQKRYIELLKYSIIDFYRTDCFEYQPAINKKSIPIFKLIIKLLNYIKPNSYVLCEKKYVLKKEREFGKDIPLNAESMIGLKRMNNIEECIFNIIENNIDGDFIETGVWRGGAVIFMKGILEILEVKHKKVWVADSFEGLPKPNFEKYAADKDDLHYKLDYLKVSEKIVQDNFRKYNLLDNNVIFLKGWFKNTLPLAPINKLSLIRLDGDMYESTLDGLKNLYPKLSIGGFIIIDDWGAVEGSRQAVIDYRMENSINEPIYNIDWTGIYWKKIK